MRHGLSPDRHVHPAVPPSRTFPANAPPKRRLPTDIMAMRAAADGTDFTLQR
jgi:hypothetical protein